MYNNTEYLQVPLPRIILTPSLSLSLSLSPSISLYLSLSLLIVLCLQPKQVHFILVVSGGIMARSGLLMELRRESVPSCPACVPCYILDL